MEPNHLANARFLLPGDNQVRLSMIGWQDYGRVEKRIDVKIKDLPQYLSRLEIWIRDMLIVSVPFAIGEGCWHWIPATVDEAPDATDK